MKKIFIGLMVCLLAILVVLGMMGQRNFSWDIRENHSQAGEQPYEMAVFDSLLARSLQNGYDVERVRQKLHWDSLLEYHQLDYDAIANTSADTSLLIVRQQYWNFDVEDALLSFAKRGGRAVYVPQTSNCSNLWFRTIPGYDGCYWELDCNDFFTNWAAFSKEWLKSRSCDHIEALTSDGDSLSLISRFVVNYYLREDEPKDDDHRNRIKHIEESFRVLHVTATPVIYSSQHKKQVYALRLDFKGGGCIVLCTLGCYFCNLGVTIPDGSDVIAAVISQIDTRPVKRIQYLEPEYWKSDNKDRKKALTVLMDNDALRFAMLLAVVMGVLLVLKGLMRKFPADRHAIEDIPDKTDVVALRRFQIRKSPLLSFLYQCSWLYHRQYDYSDLFDGNFRRLARSVKRLTGVELLTASDAELNDAARQLAKRQHLPIDEVVADLFWMRQRYHADQKSPEIFARSQIIAEKYPF